ncbi:MAG: copper resistance protein CopC [Actinomycetota bacterium]
MRPVGAPPRPRAVGLATAAFLAVVTVVLAVVPVGAHTDLIQGSPGPGQRVGGDVDFIDMVFGAPVTEVEVVLLGPDGMSIAGEMEVADGQIIRHRLDEAVTEPGRYLVEYEMISDDGDFTERSYFFDYDPAAPAPTRLGEVDIPDESWFTTRNVIAALAVLALLAACGVLVRRLRRTRAELAARRAEHAA